MLYAKLGGILAICLTIYFGYLYVVNLQEDNARLEKDKIVLEISNKSQKTLIEKKDKDIQKNKVNLTQIYKKFDKAEEDKKKLVKLFANHDFALLLSKKPGLITKRMIKATKAKFKELEDEINK